MLQDGGLDEGTGTRWRVQKLLDRHLKNPAYRWDDITDPRGRRGRRWSLGQLLNAAFAGLLANCRSLRDVEALTEEMGPAGRQYVPLPGAGHDAMATDGTARPTGATGEEPGAGTKRVAE